MNKNYFKGRTLVLATKHEKEKVMAQILEKELGVKVVVPADFDTDQFGTFTREIKRGGDQLEATRRNGLARTVLASPVLRAQREGDWGRYGASKNHICYTKQVVAIGRKHY